MNDDGRGRHKLSGTDQKPAGRAKRRGRAKPSGKERRRVGAAEISDSSRPALSHQAAHARQQPCSPTQGARRQHAQHSARAFLTSCTPSCLGGGGWLAEAGEGAPRWPLDAMVGVTGSGIKVERLRGPPSHLPGCRSRPSVVGRSGGRAQGGRSAGSIPDPLTTNTAAAAATTTATALVPPRFGRVSLCFGRDVGGRIATRRVAGAP